MGVGLVRSLQPPDILWIQWRVYNSIANTSKGVLFLPPSDVYVRSILYILYTLIKLCCTKAEWSSLVSGPGLNSSPPEAKNPGVFAWFRNNLSIANTFFQQHKRQLYTWISPDGKYWNQTDYILCSWRWRSSIQTAKTRLGADCGSDHELLIAKFRLKLRKAGKSTSSHNHSGIT